MRNLASHITMVFLDKNRLLFSLTMVFIKLFARLCISNKRGPYIKKLLIVKYPPGIGDFLVSLPFIYNLKEAYKNAEITLLVGKEIEGLCRNIGVAENIYTYNDCWVYGTGWRFDPKTKKNGILKRALFIWFLRRQHFDMAIELSGHRPFAWYLFLSGIPQRIGFAPASGIHPLLLTLPVEDKRFIVEDKRHQIEYHLDVLVKMGITPGKRYLYFKTPDTDRAFIEDYLLTHGFKNGVCLIGIHPGAKRNTRKWFPERFASVSTSLIKNYNAKIIITGSNEERGLAREIGAMIGLPVLITAGELNLPELSALIEKMSLFITNDTGAMHIAIAKKVPTISFFGPGEPYKWGAYHDKDQHIILKKDGLACSPCWYDTCPTMKCHADISVQEVIDSANILLRKTRNALNPV